jgi:hypothetical protein
VGSEEGSNRLTATFHTQEAAIEYGRDLAITQCCELIIHDCKRNVRKCRNYNHRGYASLRYEQFREMYPSYRTHLGSMQLLTS